MYQLFIKTAVIANSCNTMEIGDHSKNGASLKSQMSRKNTTYGKNIFNIFCQRIVLIIVLADFGLTINAQDIITKRDGSEIKAKVTEIGTGEVKYTRFGTTSPTYTLSKSEIFMIKYEDGEKDVFDIQSNTQTERRNNVQTQGNKSNRQQNVSNSSQQRTKGQIQQQGQVNSSTDEQYRKSIVGSFLTVMTEQSDGMAMSIEGTNTYSENGRVEENGTLTLTIIGANAEKLTLKYKISVRGRYEIKDSYIICDYNVNSVDIQPVYTATTTEVEKKAYALLEDQFVPSVKESMINDSNNDKIIELNDSRLVTENSKGEQHTKKRIKRGN
jgi:hypothetical protein